MRWGRLGWWAVAAALVAVTSCGDDDDDTNGAGAAGAGGSVACSSLSSDPCEANADCQWIAAGCHGEVLFEGCYGQDFHPSPPFCADQPCPDYDTEQACSEQEACRWWPLDCSGKTITDQCLNMGFGSPESTCE